MNALLTVKEVATQFRCHSTTVYRYILNLGLPCHRIAGRLLFDEEVILDWLKNHKIENKKTHRNYSRDLQNELTKSSPAIIDEAGGNMATIKIGRLRTANGAIFFRKYQSGRVAVLIEFYNAQDKRVREVAKNATTFEEGQQVLDRRVQEERDLRFGIKRRPRIRTFEELADEYENWAKTNKKSWRDDVGRLITIRTHFGSKHLNQISSLDVERYKEKRSKEVKHATVNKGLQILSKMFNLAIQWECMDRNPCKGVKRYDERPYRRTRTLSSREEEKLFNAIWTDELRSMVTVLLNTGMRRGELLALRWDCVDLDKQELFIKETKTNRPRLIPINQTVYNELQRLQRTRKDEGYVFINPNTGRGYQCIRKSFERACKGAKIEGLVLHDLRRTFATRLIEQGVDIVTVSQLLGHTSISTTQIYCMSSPKAKHDAVARIDALKKAHLTEDLARIWPAFQDKVTSARSLRSQAQWN